MMNTEKEKRAIQYLKAFEPESEPYYLCYSGGKDSDCIRILAELAGVKHDIVHNLTTVDAPATVKYIKSIPNVVIEKPPLSMWALIVKKKFPPTRLARYCCMALKERSGKGRLKITGVRWDESNKRRKNNDIIKVIGSPDTIKKEAEKQQIKAQQSPQGGIILNTDNAETRRFVEQCYRTTSTMINPIVDWTTADVWEFLRHYGCESNPEYKNGEKRIGCIGCPMSGAGGMKLDFAKYPKYRAAYVRAFDRMLMARAAAGLAIHDTWKNGECVMRWWVGDDPLQGTLFDFYDDYGEELEY